MNKYKKGRVRNEEDGSTAWCIVLCCFLVNVIVMGFLKCLGILIIELMKAFKATPTDVSVLVSITACLNCVAGPLACYFVMKFTARTIAFVGTVMVSFGLMISWFATSITFLYITIGVFVGFGSGLTYSPGVILIGNYFQKNRALANGIVVSGSPVGGMIMPYILNFLVRYLDCRGALLILGGLMMNAVVCTLSYKPYRKPKCKKEEKNEDNSDQVSLQARRTQGSVHIPPSTDNNESIQNGQDKSDSSSENSRSDDSSGPEFMRVSESHLKKQVPSASSGSVVVYKINEMYGKCRSVSKNRRKKRNPTENSSNSKDKPPLWPLSSPDENIGRVASDRNRCKSVFLSGTGQNVMSKQSQTKIHRNIQAGDKETTTTRTPPTEKVIAHPFQNEIRQNIQQQRSNLKIPKIGNGSHSPNYLDPGSSLFQSSSNNATQKGILNVDSGLRNRRVNRDAAKIPKKEVASASTKKLSPYILSLDHSCVIMWSNDNVAKDLIKSDTKPPRGSSSGSLQPGDLEQIRGHLQAPQDESLNSLEVTEEKESCCTRLKNWVQSSPLKNPTYLILLFSSATTAIATTNILLLIPGLGEYRGLSKAQYSTVYLIISMTDMCARLFGAFISDREILTSKTLFAGGLLFAGVSSVFIAFCDSFIRFCFACTIFGLASGFHIGIYGTLLAEIVGVDSLAVGYAFSMILNGVVQFSFIYISGRILSASRAAFTILYIFYGVTLIAGSILWFIPFIFCSKSTQAPLFNEGDGNKAELNDDEKGSSSTVTTQRSNKAGNRSRIGNKNKTAMAMSNISLY